MLKDLVDRSFSRRLVGGTTMNDVISLRYPDVNKVSLSQRRTDMSFMNSIQGFSRITVILTILYFLLIFCLLLLALWFVRKLQIKAFPKTMLTIIIVLCILIMIIYLFIGIFFYKQYSQIMNMFNSFGVRF